MADLAPRPASGRCARRRSGCGREGTATQTYLTGGVGAHHTDEAFGDPYELPNERSYCETCAAIASIMFSQRMLIITGEAKYADLLERTLYNGFLAGISLDGERYIYANPLQVRDDHVGAGNDQDYAPGALVRLRLLPPQRDAAAGLVGALRRRSPARPSWSAPVRPRRLTPPSWPRGGRRRRWPPTTRGEATVESP